jgi:hypothetical protein
MTTLFVLAFLAMVVSFVVFRTIRVLHTYFLYRGKRVVNCPETRKTEAVDVAARTVAASGFLGSRTLRLDRCSRWPEHQDCGQGCLKQIAADPENCLLWNIVSNWYLGRSCACCHQRFGTLHRLDHAPALMREDHTTIEWDQVRPEQIPEILATLKPICWNCYLAANVRVCAS